MNPLGRLGPMELAQVFSLLFQGVLIDIAYVPCMRMSPGHHACIWVSYMPPSDGPWAPQEFPRYPLGTSWGLHRHPLEIPWGPPRDPLETRCAFILIS